MNDFFPKQLKYFCCLCFFLSASCFALMLANINYIGSEFLKTLPLVLLSAFFGGLAYVFSAAHLIITNKKASDSDQPIHRLSLLLPVPFAFFVEGPKSKILSFTIVNVYFLTIGIALCLLYFLVNA